MKKFVAILLAAVMLFALAVPAFAYYYFSFPEQALKGGLVLKRRTRVIDDESCYIEYTYGRFNGLTYMGHETEYVIENNDEYVCRQLLDGEWIKTEEYSYSYDDQGNVNGLYHYLLDANGEKSIDSYWEYSEKDADGNVTKRILHLDDGKGGLYKNTEYELEYDKGNLIFSESIIYDASGSFAGRVVSTYDYDANGNIVIQDEKYYYTEGAQDPDNSSRIEMEYDDKGNATYKTYYYGGEKSSSGETAFDSKNRPIFYEVKYYSQGVASYTGTYEFSYEETADGYIAIVQKVQNQAYNAKAELEEEELSEETSIEAKNATAEVRTNLNKDVVTLDKYGNIVKKVMLSWNEQTSDWDPYATETSEYFKKTERSENPIIIDGKYDDETTDEVNPDTGAPVMSVAFATVVCGAALIICKKHK